MRTSFLKLRCRGGMLPYVISLSIVLTGIVSAFLMILYYQNIVWSAYEIKARIINNLKSGTELIQGSDISNFPIDSIFVIDLYQEGRDSVFITREKWGIIDLVHVRAKDVHFERKMSLFMGVSDSYLNRVALYLSDNLGSGLTVGGKTQFVGDVFVPKQGIHAASLTSNPFIYEKIYSGMKYQSETTLPPIKGEIIHAVSRLFSLIEKKDHVNTIGNVFRGKNWHSFNEPCIIEYADIDLELDAELRGHFVIVSSKSILVKSTSVLHDVILISPKVKIESGFSGALQIFATNEIDIGSDVQLGYPSYLCCNDSENAKINIGRDSRIEGGIIQWPIQEGSLSGSGVVVSDYAELRGVVIASGIADLRGFIDGQVFCNQTFFKDNNELVLHNWLVDCHILKREDQRVYVNIWEDDRQPLKIIKRVF